MADERDTDPGDLRPGDVEPTALDLVMESVGRIAMAHNDEMTKGFWKSTAEWTALHHDLWASYATYLYDQQEDGDDDA